MGKGISSLLSGNILGTFTQLTGSMGIAATGPIGMAIGIGKEIGSKLIGGITSYLSSATEKIHTALGLGINITQFDALGKSAERLGVTSEQVTHGIDHLSRTVMEARDGSREAQLALGRLGLTFADLQGKGLDQQFLTVAERLSQVQDAGQRVALSMQVLGRGGAELAPLLARGDQLAATMEKVKKSGGILKPSDAANIEAAHNALSRLSNVGNVLFGSLATTLAPAIVTISGMITGLVGAFRPLFQYVGGIFDFIVAAFEPAFAIITGSVRVLLAVFSPFWNIMKGAFSTAATALREVGKFISWLADLFVGSFNEIMSEVGDTGEIFEWLKAAISDVFDVLRVVVKVFVKPFIDGTKVIVREAKAAFNQIVDGINSLLPPGEDIRSMLEEMGLKFDSVKDFAVSALRQIALAYAPLLDMAKMVGGALLVYMIVPLQSGLIDVERILLRVASSFLNNFVVPLIQGFISLECSILDLIKLAAKIPNIPGLAENPFRGMADIGEGMIAGQEAMLERTRGIATAAETLADKGIAAQERLNELAKLRGEVLLQTKFGDSAKDINAFFDKVEDALKAKKEKAPLGLTPSLMPELKTTGTLVQGTREEVSAVIKAQLQNQQQASVQRLLADNNQIAREQRDGIREIAANTRPRLAPAAAVEVM